MAGKNTRLSTTKLNAVSSAVQENYPQPKALNQLTPRAKVTARAKQLFYLLLASTADKAKLASYFFENLPKRLASVGERWKLPPKDFNFVSWEAFAKYVKGRVLKIGLRTSDVREFTDDMKGRKWWFMGEILWERYIKYGPVRKFLDDTAKDALKVINDQIKNNKSMRMVSAWNKSIPITSMFGELSAGVEFLLETADGEKRYLDFGHIAFNKEGHWILPTPTEIKLPSAAGQVAKQFSEFMSRFRDAKKLIVTFEETDLERLKIQEKIGTGIVNLKTEIVDGRKLVYAELDRSKMVFDPMARNQMVVRPGSEAWGTVKKLARSPNIDIGVGATAKDIDVLKPFEKLGFNFWKIVVDTSRTPFEQFFEAIFLGKK